MILLDNIVHHTSDSQARLLWAASLLGLTSTLLVSRRSTIIGASPLPPEQLSALTLIGEEVEGNVARLLSHTTLIYLA